ncbi:lactate utilization protein [Enterococcus sp. LJL99]
MEAIKLYHQTLAESLEKKLRRRNFGVSICENGNEAKTLALTLIDSDKTVAFGGSQTIKQVEIIEALYERKQKIINRDLSKTIEERHDLMKQSLLADYYLTSVNGISEEGILVNVDNIGNRVAALAYGPDKVILFAGINKIYGSVEMTIEMIRKKVAPKNSFRLGLTKTPCIKKGTCENCLVEESICNLISITRRSAQAERIHIILILEELGF